MCETRKKKRWSPEEIVAALRRVLVDRVEISKVCEEAGCCPSQVYRWQKTFFDQGVSVFRKTNGSAAKKVKAAEARADELEKRLQRKHEVLSELVEEHVRLKKSLGAS